MLPNQLIILGGGASVRPYWDGEFKDKGLFDLLPKLFACGLNYSYRFVKTSLYCGIDEKFFQENYNDIIKLPLYLGKLENVITAPLGLGKAYLFPKSFTYDRNLTNGIYSSTLAGLFALSTFIKFMDGGEIFLLGYDYGPTRDSQGNILKDDKGRALTHWYQGKVDHRGIGKINWYTSTLIDPKKAGTRITNAEKEFRVYAEEPRVKIYNVNPQSVIPTFPKISYDEFLAKIEKRDYNQDEIRKEVEGKFKALIYFYESARKNGIPIVPITNILNQSGPFKGIKI